MANYTTYVTKDEFESDYEIRSIFDWQRSDKEVVVMMGDDGYNDDGPYKWFATLRINDFNNEDFDRFFTLSDDHLAVKLKWNPETGRPFIEEEHGDIWMEWADYYNYCYPQDNVEVFTRLAMIDRLREIGPEIYLYDQEIADLMDAIQDDIDEYINGLND